MAVARTHELKQCLNFLTDSDIVKFGTSSKSLTATFCEMKEAFPPLAKAYFTYVSAKKYEKSIISYLLGQQRLSTQLSEYPILEKQVGDQIYQQVLEKNQKRLEQDKAALIARLNLETPANGSANLTKLVNFFHDDTALVVTHRDRYKLGMKFKNYFEQKETDGYDENYLLNRYCSEFSFYLNSAPQGSKHLLHTHPYFGSLQPMKNIGAIKSYGDSFFVSKNKQNTVALYGNSLGSSGPNCYPVALVKENMPALLAQLPDKALQACLTDDAVELRNGSNGINYIEFQRWKRFETDNPKDIPVWHFKFSENCPDFKKIDEYVQKGVQVTLGKNPFRNKSFIEAFRKDQQNQYVLEVLKKNIYQSVLYLAESSPEYVSFKSDDKALNFSFKITKNSSQLHQVQVASVLCRMGLQDYFKKRGAFSLYQAVREKPGSVEKTLDYTLPLSGLAQHDDSLTDHDAYINDQVSLSSLLNKFLQRIISIILVSYQNEQYLLQHSKPHPVTGAGATEEQNQIGDLSLDMNGKPYSIDAHWYFDRVFLEIKPKIEEHDLFYETNNAITSSVCNVLRALFHDKLKSRGNKIYIKMSVEEILEKLAKHRKNWHASIYYDDNTGQIYLANRHHYGASGYAPSGGRSCDPFHSVDIVRGSEFGKVKNYKEILKNGLCFSSSEDPPTNYYLAPISTLENLSLDLDEFVPGSLNKFNLYELGNLSDEDLVKAAQSFSMSVDQYQFMYGKALPLRPLPGILEYIKYYERKLNVMLSKSYSDSPVLTISQAMKTSGDYWLPEKEFGTIEIKGEPKTLAMIALSISKSNPCASVLYDNTILKIKINPFQLASVAFKSEITMEEMDYKMHDEMLLSVLVFNNSFEKLQFCQNLWSHRFEFKDIVKFVLKQYNDLFNKLDIHHNKNHQSIFDYLMELVNKNIIKKEDLKDHGEALLNIVISKIGIEKIQIEDDQLSACKIFHVEDVKKTILDRYNKFILNVRCNVNDRATINCLLEFIKKDWIKKEDLQDGGAMLLCLLSQNNDLNNIQYLLENKNFDVFSRTVKHVNVLYFVLLLLIDSTNLDFKMPEYIFSRMQIAYENNNKCGFSNKQQSEMQEVLANEVLIDPCLRSPALAMLASYCKRSDSEVKNFKSQLDFLLEVYKPIVFMKDKHQRSLLHAFAESYENPDVIPQLIKAGLNITDVDDLGDSVLHCAISSMNIEMVKYLVTYHQELLLIKNKFNHTPTFYVFQSYDMDNLIDSQVVKLLLNHDDNLTRNQLDDLLKLVKDNKQLNNVEKAELTDILNQKIAKLSPAKGVSLLGLFLHPLTTSIVPVDNPKFGN